MGAAYYVMAILGCGDAGTACQQLRIAEARYTNLAACEAAYAAVLPGHSDIDFPVVMAKCRRAHPSTAARRPRPHG